MSNTLEDKYLELWKYFEDRADNVKEAMFNTITWTIGFAAALLGFIFAKITDFDSDRAAIGLSSLVILSSVTGLSICLYASFSLLEARKHIKNNWDRADRCKKHIMNINEIIKGNGRENRQLLEIWWRLGIIVLFFVVAFILALGWALHECSRIS